MGARRGMPAGGRRASRDDDATRGAPLGQAGPEGPPAPSGALGRLFVVATPIGNLGDVTLRALDVLRSVPLVAAEDTRITRRLFARHGITTHLVAHHARNEATSLAGLLDHLRGGADLALVTDAGTPLVSDPGGGLVAAWASAGGSVVPIPGPSSVLAALVASGVAGPRWSFEGFLPRSGRERRARIARLADDERASVVFEAPGRLAATLADLAAACGPGRPAAVCRELTKIHEEVARGTLGELASRAAAGDILARGEIVIVLGDRPSDDRREAATAMAATSLVEARASVERLVAAGLARGEAARRVSAATGLPRRSLYVVAEARES